MTSLNSFPATISQPAQGEQGNQLTNSKQAFRKQWSQIKDNVPLHHTYAADKNGNTTVEKLSTKSTDNNFQ